ncbi:MAG: hypothetical protein Q9220_006620 [cf. Caloplaca sp. 1 TL-2023]
MSSLQITVPPEYGYVLLSATASTFISIYHSALTAKFRRASKTPYPNPYASAAEAKDSKEKYLFNCAQRAHAQFLENQPSYLISLLISGLKYPVASAAMGAVWCVGRVVFARGYVDPEKTGGSARTRGSFYAIPQFGLMLMAAYTSLSMAGAVDKVMGLVK